MAVIAAFSLTACNRTQARTETTTVATTTTAVDPVTGQPVRTIVAPADPCPSVGTLAETRGPAIALNGAKLVRLNTVCSAEAMTAHLRQFGQGTRYLLVADDLRAGVQPGALFELRFGPPTTGEAAVLGTLNFYAANQPTGVGQPHSISYDVTNQVMSLSVAGWPAGGLGVAIAPSTTVVPGSDATVGALRLVAEAPTRR
jgi:hypothetical protein